MRKLLFTLVLTCLVISCKQENKSYPDVDIKKNEDVFLDFYFPDTVKLNAKYFGKILYKSSLDSITTELFKEGDSLRILALYLRKKKSIEGSNYKNIINAVEKDTFVPYKSDSIAFNLKFINKGLNYIEGVLEDKIYLKEADTSEMRIITKYHYITVPVYVDENFKNKKIDLKKYKIPILDKGRF